jgi:thiamine biosynthesis lipoprotein
MLENRKRVWLSIVVGLCLIAAVLFFAESPTNRPVEVDGGYREVMGTFARIVAVANNAQQARKCIEAGFDELRRIDAAMSAYKKDSELSKVNREAFGGPIKVSDELFGLLQKSVEFSRLSSGAFDITVGPLVELWRKAGEANVMPDEDKLAEARTRVGYAKLILQANEQSVRFAVDGMRLDLGGVAKGYAVDKVVELMQQNGAVAGMVDSGGNIRCFGKPAGKDAWLIGLQDPNIVDRQPLMTLRLADCAVATSGDYRRFVTIAGKKVSHIIDTNTAMGVNKLSSDTVIAKTALEADAFSTAINVLGTEKGLALIESLPDIECILITAGPEYRVIESNGAGKMVHQQAERQ